jgi:hypothetical protein
MEAILKERVADTELWLFQEPAFQSWFNGIKPLLWICSSTGSGKICLFSGALPMLLSKLQPKPTAGMVWQLHPSSSSKTMLAA